MKWLIKTFRKMAQYIMDTWSRIVAKAADAGVTMTKKSGDLDNQCPTRSEVEERAMVARAVVTYGNSPETNELVSVTSVAAGKVVVSFEVWADFTGYSDYYVYSEEWAEQHDKNSTINPLDYIKDIIDGNTAITYSSGDIWTYEELAFSYEYQGTPRITVNGTTWSSGSITLSADTTIRYIFETSRMNGAVNGTPPSDYVPTTYTGRESFNVDYVFPKVERKNSVTGNYQPILSDEYGDMVADYETSTIRKYIDILITNETIDTSKSKVVFSAVPQFSDENGHDTFEYWALELFTSGGVQKYQWEKHDVYLSDIYFSAAFDSDRQRLYLSYLVTLKDINTNSAISLAPAEHVTQYEGLQVEDNGDLNLTNNLYAVWEKITELGLNAENRKTYSGTVTFSYNFTV